MKTQTLKLTTLLALLTTTLLLANCKGEPSCPDAQVSTRYMSEEYKKILPYTGFDTLYFLSNTNDTIECIGQGRSTFFEPNSVREMNPDCNVYYTTNHEGYNINYGGLFSIKNSYLNYSLAISHKENTISFRTRDIGSVSDGLHDSILIQNKMYYKVSEYKSANLELTLFINREFGVIEIRDNVLGKTYSYINKK